MNELLEFIGDYEHIIMLLIGFFLGWLIADIRAIYNMKYKRRLK